MCIVRYFNSTLFTFLFWYNDWHDDLQKIPQDGFSLFTYWHECMIVCDHHLLLVSLFNQGMIII